MSSEQNRKWGPIIAIAGSLAAWGIILAYGAYRAPVGQSSGHDGGKLLVVAVTIGGFLLLWTGILLISASKLRRRSQEKLANRTNQDDTPS